MDHAPLTNDTAKLIPRTVFDGPSLQFDFPAFRVGVAEYAEGPTGCTVFQFPHGAATAIDIRGGSPKTYGNYEWNHAICLAGGSVYGLETTTGVAAELFAMHGYSTSPQDIAHVSSAIIFDPPARENAVGAIVDRNGQVVRGHLNPATGTRHHLIEDVGQRDATALMPPQHNTTLTVLVINQQLDGPFHTMYDGDVLYAVTTNETNNPVLDDVALGAVAAEVAWDAVLSSVRTT
jgi:L-aminopeptidase/D-esterase-like protein